MTEPTARKATKPTHPFEDDLTRLSLEMGGEGDRAAVILAAAKLDLQLVQLLQRRLVACASSNDELLDGDSPLGTFSSRINLTYRLGLIDAEFARALHLVRRIRNAFAHEIDSRTLTLGSHRDRVRELSAPVKREPEFDQLALVLFAKNEGAARDFRMTVAMMAICLDTIIRSTDPLPASSASSFVPREWAARHPQPSASRVKPPKASGEA